MSTRTALPHHQRSLVTTCALASLLLLCGLIANIFAIATATTSVAFFVAFGLVLVFIALLIAVAAFAWRAVGIATHHLRP